MLPQLLRFSLLECSAFFIIQFDVYQVSFIYTVPNHNTEAIPTRASNSDGSGKEKGEGEKKRQRVKETEKEREGEGWRGRKRGRGM